jgi:hypothetical protein
MGNSYSDTLASFDKLVSSKDAQKLLAQDTSFAQINGYMPDGSPVFQAAVQTANTERRKPSLMCFDTVEYEETRFLVNPYIPMGKITIVQGDSGTGKTAFACKLAAEVSTGGGILGHKCIAGNVLLLSVEDDPATLRGRIEAGGGDVSRCFFIDNACDFTFTSPEVEEAAKENAVRLLVFDPLQAFLGAKVDMHRANETRPVLAHLADMAKRNDFAVVIISHLSKGLPGTKALYRTLGSVDIVAASRSVLHIGRNPEDEEQCVVCHIKSSSAKAGRSFAYRIGSRGGVQWDGYSTLTAEDLQMAAIRKEQGLAFEDDPAVIAISRLLEENQQGVYVTYEQLGNYATRMLGYPPCATGKDWRIKLNAIARELLERSRIRIQFENARTVEHIELGERVTPTGMKERGILIQKHMPAAAYQVHLGTADHT